MNECTRIIGITGGIGSGKSTVSAILHHFGMPIIDLDAIARELMTPPAQGYKALHNAFPEFFDSNGNINRNRMRNLIFSHPMMRTQVEHILHPLIHDVATIEISKISLKNTSNIIGIEIPLLYSESIWHKHLNHLLVVDCTTETQISRVSIRNGLPKAEILPIIRSQISRMDRLRLADSVIFNDNCSASALRLKTLEWHSMVNTHHHSLIAERRM